VLAAHAPERRIVPQQVGELRALMNEVGAGEAGHLVLEAGHADQIAQDRARVVEAEGLVEVRREEIMRTGNSRP
jgi:hypothetical protein